MTEAAKRRIGARPPKPESQKGGNTPPSVPFATAPKAFAKRLTLDLTEADHRALKILAAEHGASMVDLLRGALRLVVDQPAIAEAAIRTKPMADPR